MKRNVLYVLLALAALGEGMQPAAAQSVRYGGIKDYGGVPVPAPVPVAVYQPAWYFRFDAGIGLANDSNGSVAGDPLFDVVGLTTPSGPAFLNDDFDTFTSFGAGIGYRWSKNFRMDWTVESRTNGHFVVESPEYISPNTALPVNVRDQTSLRGGFTLFNLYYDIFTHAGFTPYVGAGIGFSFNELTRASVTDIDGVEIDASKKKHNLGLAAMFTAGFSYQITEMTVLDFNYRYLHLEGSEIGLETIGFTDPQNSTVSIGETNEHQLRAGVRFNVF